MQRHILWIMAASVALWDCGCASHRPQSAAEGQKIFTALQQATAAAGKKAEPSLALVKVEREGAASRPASRITVNASSASDGDLSSGIILTKQGHVLVSSVIKPDQDTPITVIVGENEYVARALKVDETLGMTILKLDSDETFTPLDISKGADLAVGEWAVVLKPSDEDSDYQKFSTPVACLGERAGRYRRFMVSQGFGPSFSGSLVVNLCGQPVGLLDRGSVVAITDLHDDLVRFVAEATGKSSPEEDKKKKGWFGAMVEPINKDYAKARKLPTSALLVLYVGKKSPADTAGLRPGDLIVGFNGKPLRFSGIRALDYFAKSLQPRTGEKWSVKVLRDSKPVELAGTFTKSPERETLRAEDLGVSVSEITDSDVFSQNLPMDRGVMVTDVQRGSPAANSGTLSQTLISRRDLIIELAGQPTPDVAAFSKALESIRQSQPPVVLVKYYRGVLTGYAALNLALGEKDNGNKNKQ
jgi:serine protease Do